MSRFLILILGGAFIIAWPNVALAQSISDSCRVSFMDMFEDDITDLGSFVAEISADELTVRKFRISRKVSPQWSFVTVGVGYFNPGIPKHRTDINEIGFVLIVAKQPFKQSPDLSLEASLLSNIDAALAYIPMNSLKKIVVSKNVVGRGGRLLIVSMECERKPASERE